MIHHNQVSRQNKANKTNSNLTRNYKVMHIEIHSQNQNDQKRDFIHDKLKLLLISNVSFTPLIPLPPMTAGFEPAFDAKGAGALQKGQ